MGCYDHSSSTDGWTTIGIGGTGENFNCSVI